VRCCICFSIWQTIKLFEVNILRDFKGTLANVLNIKIDIYYYKL